MPIEELPNPFVRVHQKKRNFIVTSLSAAALTAISYVSVRGRDTEEGAVQRLLNPMRIGDLKEYALSGGDYSASIILNWVNQEFPPREVGEKIIIPVQPRSAQIIDGQHRVEGLREAIKADPTVGEIDIPVALYTFLNTQACADIFVSINNEQKPAPRSLVLDLYGVASPTVVDPASVRARDIANSLNTDQESCYFGLIRFPGAARSQLGVDLSTVVAAIKPLVEEKGFLDAVSIKEFESQLRVLKSFFSVLSSWYGDQWGSKDNIFLSAAGFTGAVDFFKNKMIPYCNVNRSYRVDFMKSAMALDSHLTIKRADVKGLQGRTAARQVTDKLADLFSPAAQDGGEIQL